MMMMKGGFESRRALMIISQQAERTEPVLAQKLTQPVFMKGNKLVCASDTLSLT